MLTAQFLSPTSVLLALVIALFISVWSLWLYVQCNMLTVTSMLQSLYLSIECNCVRPLEAWICISDLILLLFILWLCILSWHLTLVWVTYGYAMTSYYHLSSLHTCELCIVRTNLTSKLSNTGSTMLKLRDVKSLGQTYFTSLWSKLLRNVLLLS